MISVMGTFSAENYYIRSAMVDRSALDSFLGYLALVIPRLAERSLQIDPSVAAWTTSESGKSDAHLDCTKILGASQFAVGSVLVNCVEILASNIVNSRVMRWIYLQ